MSRFTWDPTINLGHVLTILAILGAGTTALIRVESRLAHLESTQQRHEREIELGRQVREDMRSALGDLKGVLGELRGELRALYQRRTDADRQERGG